MRRLVLLIAAAVAALLVTIPATADTGDSASISATSALIGQQLLLTLHVVTPRGATVDVDPGAKSWNGITIVRVQSQSSQDSGNQSTHTMVVVITPFSTGDIAFTPAILVTANAVSTSRAMPGVQLTVTPTLGPDDKLELSPLPGPQAIGGGESPWLKPGIAAGIVAGIALLGAGGYFGWRTVRRRRRSKPAEPEVALTVPDLRGAEALMETDPVSAYRKLASAVRGVLSDRYGFAAFALTTGELQGRMEARGIDRWQARLVGGLLQNCDAVVYAGYLPAGERRQADLTMAREIIEADS